MFDSIIHTRVLEVLCSKLWTIIADYLFGQSKASKNNLRASTVVLAVAARKGIASIHLE